jgi:HEAT repeat protein
MEETIYTQPLSDTQRMEINKLIKILASNSDGERVSARKALIKFGHNVTPQLILALKDYNEHVRWEAAKIFGILRDPAAASTLVEAMSDDSYSVSWLSAEALIALNGKALIPLLEGLQVYIHSPNFRNGAHHVLHTLERTEKLNAETLKVLDVLRAVEPEVAVPFAAQNALKSLQQS